MLLLELWHLCIILKPSKIITFCFSWCTVTVALLLDHFLVFYNALFEQVGNSYILILFMAGHHCFPLGWQACPTILFRSFFRYLPPECFDLSKTPFISSKVSHPASLRTGGAFLSSFSLVNSTQLHTSRLVSSLGYSLCELA